MGGSGLWESDGNSEMEWVKRGAAGRGERGAAGAGTVCGWWGGRRDDGSLHSPKAAGGLGHGGGGGCTFGMVLCCVHRIYQD